MRVNVWAVRQKNVAVVESWPLGEVRLYCSFKITGTHSHWLCKVISEKWVSFLCICRGSLFVTSAIRSYSLLFKDFLKDLVGGGGRGGSS